MYHFVESIHIEHFKELHYIKLQNKSAILKPFKLTNVSQKLLWQNGLS